jgi:hypothetical protein
MKPFFCRALLGLACCFAAWSAQAQDTFVSAMGFRSVVPAGWTSLTQEEVRKNAQLFETGFAAMRQANPEMLKQIEGEIRGGRIELLFAPATNPAFRDNINVRSTPLIIPTNERALQAECATLPAQLQQLFGRPMKLYACRFEKTPMGRAVFLDFDGATEGIHSLQYNMPSKTPGTALQVTGTFSEESLEQQRTVFEGFVRAIKPVK